MKVQHLVHKPHLIERSNQLDQPPNATSDLIELRNSEQTTPPPGEMRQLPLPGFEGLV